MCFLGEPLRVSWTMIVAVESQRQPAIWTAKNETFKKTEKLSSLSDYVKKLEANK